MNTTQRARVTSARRRVLTMGGLAVLSIMVGCAPAYVALGDSYRNQDAPVTALAYYAVAVANSPGDLEARAAWALAYQRLAREHRREIERLTSSAQARRALGRLARLEELALRGEELGLPADDSGGLAAERGELEGVARQEMLTALDQRMERGALMWSDVEVCRQWAALAPRDPMGSRCERLADRFRYYVAVRPTRSLASGLLRPLIHDLKQRSTDRLQVVGPEDPRLNALLELTVETPLVEDRPWRIVERRTCRKWIPKTDKKGRPIVHTIKVPPTREQVRAARATKTPVPPTRVVRKKVWMEVAGEYKRSRQDRVVAVPWTARLRDLREHRIVTSAGGRAGAQATSTYDETSGDPRACPRAGGRGAATPMPSGEQLARKAAEQIGGTILTWVLERVD